MDRFKVVFTDYYYPDISEEETILGKLANVEIVDCTTITPGGIKDDEELLGHVIDADAIITQFARVSRKVIEKLQNCKIVARYGIGVDTIDVEAAHEKGIVVGNVPDYCIEEVSDSAITHMLNCVRKLTLSNNLLRARSFDYERVRPIRRFADQVVGLLAFGHIARRVAEKLRPFGNTVLAFDPYFRDQTSYPWVKFVSLEELLRAADILSVHAPLNQETRHLINKERMDLLKPGAIIVNTSRGGLIDENALVDALRSGKLGGAGLDVLDCADEDYADSPLAEFSEKVFLTPHMSWYSEEAVRELQRKVAMNVYETLANGKPLYQV